MFTFTTTAYNSQGEALETETQTDSWSATEICNSLYDRCLLAELGIKGFTPAGEQHLIKS